MSYQNPYFYQNQNIETRGSQNPKKRIDGRNRGDKFARTKLVKNKPRNEFTKCFREGKDYSFRDKVTHLDYESISESQIMEHLKIMGGQPLNSLLIHNVPDFGPLPNLAQQSVPQVPQEEDPFDVDFPAKIDSGFDYDDNDHLFDEDVNEEHGDSFSQGVVLIPSFFTEDEVNHPVSGSGIFPLHLSPMNGPFYNDIGTYDLHPNDNDIHEGERDFLYLDPPPMSTGFSPVDDLKFDQFPPNSETEEEEDRTLTKFSDSPEPRQNTLMRPSSPGKTQFFVRNSSPSNRTPDRTPPPPTENSMLIRRPPPPSRHNQGDPVCPRPSLPVPTEYKSLLSKKSRTSKVRLIETYQNVVDLTQGYPWSGQGGIILENCYDGVSMLKIDLGCFPLGHNVHVNFKVFRIGYIKGSTPKDLKVVILELEEELRGPKMDPSIFRPCKKKVKAKYRKRAGQVRADVYFDNPRQHVGKDGVLCIEYRLNNFVSRKTKGINRLEVDVFVNSSLVRQCGYYFKKDNRTEAKTHVLKEPECVHLDNTPVIRNSRSYDDKVTKFFGKPVLGKVKKETKEMKLLSMFIARVANLANSVCGEIGAWEERKQKKKKKFELKLRYLNGQLKVFQRLLAKSSSAYRKLEGKMMVKEV